MQWAFFRRAPVGTSPPRRPSDLRRRRAFFESLENRCVMAPLGAFPDDTGEYLLGDVLVTVVLMESDSTLPGADVSTENWTPALIQDVQSRVQQGMDWWKQTLINSTNFYYNPALPLLNFKYDWTWALDPVETIYEPINRFSSFHTLWINDFLDQPNVDFAQTGDIYKDVKAFNNFQRERHGTDWAFTIFVANSTADNDDLFPENLSPAPGEVNYRGAFAFLGGQFLVVPSQRPATTFAHEAGHIFYALDEYSTGHSYQQRAGYYNAQNLNGARDNPTPNFLTSQQPSIMATGTSQTNAWTNFVTSDSSKATVGWRDSDGDGVMDVLDVPFELKGTGVYSPGTAQYKFKGSSSVRTLKNQNTFGGQHTDLLYNDISINRIRRAEYSLDGGAWTLITEFASAPTKTSFDLTINDIGAGPHIIKIRTFDQRTGASSEEFVGTINGAGQASPPQAMPSAGGITGFAFRDDNGNGQWDSGEHALSDWGVELLNVDDELLTLAQTIEPSDFTDNTLLNTIQPGVSMSVIGQTAGGDSVMSRTSTRGVGKIFYAGSSANETFVTKRDSTGNNLAVDRRLRIDFGAGVSTVSLKALGASASATSVGRLDAYDANNNLIGRYTTAALSLGQSELMSITRPSADIKYVIASSHLETEVLFDTLIAGPQTATTTNADGSFNLAALPAGTYNLRVIAAPNYTPVTPLDSRATVTVGPSNSTSNNLYFAYQFGGNPWHNLLDPLNANGVSGITAFDALAVINYLNLHPVIQPLVASEALPNRYLDVNNDNKVTAFDALQIINFLNLNGVAAAEAPPSVTSDATVSATSSSAPSGNSGGSGSGEGVAAAQTADEYFAANPIHVSQQSKDSSHMHFDGDEGVVEAIVNTGHLETRHDEFASLLSSPLSGDSQAGDKAETDQQSSASRPIAAALTPLLERLRTLRLSSEQHRRQVAEERLAAVREQLSSLYDLLAADHEQLARLRSRLERIVR